jgi:hypothetical protein
MVMMMHAVMNGCKAALSNQEAGASSSLLLRLLDYVCAAMCGSNMAGLA